MDTSNVVMSPTAHPSSVEIVQCADCSADDPQWASINRGVLICTDCCSVHRNLGELTLFMGTYDVGSIFIFKVQKEAVAKVRVLSISSDPVLPTKEVFIKAKYVDHLFIRKPSKDGEPWSSDDVNKQLWSCVRTAHVDTTLRLLAMGADVNYVDSEKGNSPLHVAAKEGQAMQVELLHIYGADPLLCNAAELTPAQLAQQEGFHQQHFLIPELTAKNSVETLRSVRFKVQALPDFVFEKLLQDVYDEVDRRETQAAWMAMNQGKITSGNEHCVAVFLPVGYNREMIQLNPSFSATRNQLRQKLAKFDVREFATLIIDVLKEAKRRHFGRPPDDVQETADTSSNLPNLSSNTRMDSSEPNRDYDEVADFPSRTCEVNNSGTTRRSFGNKTRSTSSIDVMIDGRVCIDDVLELKERMTENENKLNSISHANIQIMKILTNLQNSMEHMKVENTCLKDEIMRLTEQTTLMRRLLSPGTTSHISTNHMVERAHSVGVERGDRIGRPPIESESRMIKRHGSIGGTTSGYSRMVPTVRMGTDNHRDNDETRDNPRDKLRPRDSSREKLRPRDRNPDANEYATITAAPQFVASKVQEAFSEPVFPDNFIRQTENLTVAIRSLLTDAQHNQLHGRSSHYAHKIASLVDQIIYVIPRKERVGKTEEAISALMEATMVRV
ncbi:unnamed protein product [Angiostrongylus costaricensis]|uniref:Arf-GAP domain-containing protein n=1 Tax=Angiostrongylus costaricensis TaxID=334426 RepID=A0A158PHY8_ANGCS|nr:unnamed protein product [Angiostrongylus costaricensis]